MTRRLFATLMSSIMALFGCQAQSAEGFTSVDADQFEQVISDTTVVRLDVRTADEYAEGHIANAINIDVLKDDFEPNALAALPKDKRIALYCRSGRRSKQAANILAAKGYQVIELSTGYNGWVAAGKPTTP